MTNTAMDYGMSVVNKVCDKLFEVHVEIEVDLDIDASWSNGFPGSQEEPPEPKGYELHGFTAKFRGADVTDLISDADVQELINDAEYDG